MTSFIGTPQNETRNGTDGNDSLSGGGGNGFLMAMIGPGTDVLEGSAGDDKLIGTTGNDTLDGLAGNDTMTGLRGDDVYVVDAAGDVVVEAGNGGRDTVRTALAQASLAANVEELTYTGSGDFHGIGNSIANLITGSASGDNTLDGGAGADTLVGGSGRNEFTVDSARDVIELDANEYSMVKVAFSAAGTYTLQENVNDGVITASSTVKVNLAGNALDNVLTGSAGSNLLDGGSGDDTLDGGAGADTLQGGNGDDTYIVSDNLDKITEGESTGASDTALVSVASYFLPAWVEVGRYTGTGAVALTGNTTNNSLVGGAGDDTLNGGNGGMDTLEGGIGNDLLVAGAGDSVLVGGAGNDSLRGGAGDDVLVGGDGANTADGGAGADTVQLEGELADYTFTRQPGSSALVTRIGTSETVTMRNIETVYFTGTDEEVLVADLLAGQPGEGNDTITGSDANDTLDGLQGQDQMAGGKGDDTYKVDHLGDTIVEAAAEGIDTAIVNIASGVYGLAAEVEHGTLAGNAAAGLAGNAGANRLTGNGAANTLSGAEGNDTLDGGAGADQMTGGAGDDIFFVDEARDVVIEAAGQGIDTVSTSLAKYTLAANVENLVYTGTAVFTAAGNELDNMISGGTNSETIFGAAGSDTYVAIGAAADYVRQRPNSIDLTLIKGTQRITLKGMEQVKFTDGVKTMAELFVNVASIGNDTLTGTSGNDTIDGMAGIDEMSGGQGNDTYVVDQAGDKVIEAAAEGRDTVQVAMEKGTYALGANVEDAKITSTGLVNLTGNALANLLTGNDAVNTLVGGAGDDTLVGGMGNDVLTGGAGNDTYHVDAAGDKITELVNEGTDTVITTLGTYTLAADVENLTYSGAAAFSANGNALDNVITGGKGNDTVNGAGGTDTYVVTGNYASYVRSRPNAGDVVLTKGSQKITLRNFEKVQFADGVKTMAELFLNIVSAGNDTLVGTDGNDTLDGKGGADLLTGGKGDDLYVVDSGGDTIVELANEGRDTVHVSLLGGTYLLGANVEDAKVVSGNTLGLAGNALANLLTGNAAANTLTGNAGNDTLDGGRGADSLLGGVGDDTYHVDVAGDKVIELAGEGRDTIVTSLAKFTLATHFENLVYNGTALFSGTGNALDNEMAIGGSSGTLDGGEGTDTFVAAGAFADYARQRPNATELVLVKGNQKITLKNIEQARFTDGVKTLAELNQNVASPANDTLAGTDGNDALDGLAGADRLVGGKGNDVYTVDNAGDTVIELADEGVDTVNIAIAAKMTYMLAEHVENATITSTTAINVTGNAANNTLTGNATANILAGGGGNDTLIGGKGNDTLAGGDGDDIYSVDATGDVLTETASGGRDIVQATASKYTLAANVEDLFYVGTSLFTGIGNALDNVMEGGAFNDKLTGGQGADTFVIGAGNDTVTDFTSGVDTLAINRGIGEGKFNSETMDAPGGFASSTELVFFTKTVSSLTLANVAKAIGSATSAYGTGDTALFAVHDAAGTALFLFTSKNDDAIVSGNELVQIASLTGVQTFAADDISLPTL
ncbi:calcium-binding protein [Pseudoduganella sp. SL102]|uniref:calcium-binding protein n=1 Tax=Pseudoduganella sp. SL102 TaxID=2995154 RepID=UPI00248D3827|nr:calcium-binding protein [Pseudoduganella sp. SL102]WBS03492.1 calcium-binding protein [Pseudoduganella sp. SL102]